jgi:hypothetical protein
MILMNVNDFIQIVNGVGFPIAACVAMGAFIVWYIKKITPMFDDLKISINTLNEKLEKLDVKKE